MSEDLEDLLRLARIAAAQARADVAQARAVEGALASEAGAIDEVRRDAMRLEGRDAARVAAGLDVAWQHWVGQRQARVARDHALARARALEEIERARQSIAREEALAALVRESQGRDRRERQSRADADLNEMSILQRRSR